MFLKKMGKLIYSNKFCAVAILAIQLFVLGLGYIWLSDYNVYIFGATSLIGAVLILYEINRKTSPEFKITWIMLIAIIPVFGVLLYLYLHLDWSSRGIKNSQQDAERLVEIKQDKKIIEEIRKKDKDTAGLCEYLSHYGGAGVYKNTQTQYFSMGDDFIEDLTESLKTAEKFIFMEYFIVNQQKEVWPEILAVLKERAKAGVEVRVLVDGMGCMGILPKNYGEQLKKFDIKYRVFSPIQPLLSTYQNNRDHRKITVIDGKTAYCGGINLADEYANKIRRFGEVWKDTGVKLLGDAAAGFTGLFLKMWNGMESDDRDDTKEKCSEFINETISVKADGYVIPYGDSPLDNITVGKMVYLHMINTASEYVHIMTPYLVIDDGMYEAMMYAVQRGVDVRIIMPGVPDKKYIFYLAHTYYPQLLKAGVKIYEYHGGFVHAKTVVCDGNKAVVGTVNFDYRSMYLHYECAAFLYDVPQIMEIEKDFSDMLFDEDEVTLEKYKKFNPVHTIEGRIIRIFAPLL